MNRTVHGLLLASSLGVIFAACGPSTNATQAETPAPAEATAAVTPPEPAPAETPAAPTQVAAAAPAPAAPTAPAAPAAPRGAAPAAPGTPGAVNIPPVVLEFKPLFDDLMTMLIQPRHIKLWAAAQQQNWTLAAFELNEMRGAFDRIAATIPKYQNVNLGPTFISMMSGPFMAINGAINAKNIQQFNTAYLDLTNTCTSCHQALNHPFLVIKVPDASALTNFANQDFKPVPAAAAPK